MIKYILFSEKGFGIIESVSKQNHKAPNGRTTITFYKMVPIYKTPEFRFDCMSTYSEKDGEIGWMGDDAFPYENKRPMIEYIFEKMTIDWWKRKK